MQTIEVIISPTGETTVTANGIKGASCKDATAAIEKALGMVAQSTPTGEFYEVEENTITTR